MLDLEEFESAISSLYFLPDENGPECFIWSGLPNGLDELQAMYVHEVGLITLPIDSDVAAQLAKRFTPTKYRAIGMNTCCEVEASQITVITKGGKSNQRFFQELAYNTVANMLDVSFENLNLSIVAKLDRLVMCGNGESYKAGFNSSNEPGKFGTLFLKLPVEANGASGRLVIFDGIKERQVDLGENSGFNIAATAGFGASERKTHFSVHSDPEAITAVMIFNLIWEDSRLFGQDIFLAPHYFPEFLMLTDEIKTILKAWEITGHAPEQEVQSIEPTKFLCMPFSTELFGENGTLSSVKGNDTIFVKSLMSITFIDVQIAYVQPAENADSTVPAGSLSSMFVFKHSPDQSILDDIFDFAMDPATHLLYGNYFRSFYTNIKETPAPVILVRSRSRHHLLIRESRGSRAGNFVLKVLVENLERRFIDCADKKAIENPHFLKSLLKELQQIIELSKESVDTAECTACFFARLFDFSYRLEVEHLAATIFKDVLDVLNVWKLENLFVCCCDSTGCVINNAIAFAKLVHFSKGWSSYPDAMKKLTNQMLADENASYVSEIALHLLKSDDLKGASETFQLLLEAVENSLSTPGEMDKIFHAGLLSLALRLHQEEPNQKALDTLLHLIKHIEPSQFAKLAKKMCEWITEESLDCKHFLNELGSVAIENQFRKFTPQQFLMTVEAFRSSDMPELVQQSWKIICSRCIEIHDSKEASKCLLCDFLKELKSDEDRQRMAADLAKVDELGEAVKCSITKLKSNPASLDVNGYVEYVHCIQLMEEPAQLSQLEVVEHFSGCFACLTPESHYLMLDSLYQSKSSLIAQSTSTMNRIFENLLEHIGNSDQMTLFEGNAEVILLYAAWFSQLATVKLIMEKVRRAMATSKAIESNTVPSPILRVLRVKVKDGDAASSLYFKRETFNYLIHESLRTVENQKVRTLDFAICFRLLSRAEKSFIDATPAFITNQLNAAANSFTFYEIVVVVIRLFEKETSSEEPSLKKFPTMWQTFRELCFSLLSKWESPYMEGKGTGLRETHCVSLMRCFLWIADEKGIARFCRLINRVQRFESQLVDVHSVIIREIRTMDLATILPHGLLAFNDLIDARIQILNQRLVKHSADQARRVPGSLISNTSHESPSKYRKVDSNDETNDQVKWQEEIDELQALRKHFLTRLLGPAEPP